MYDSMGSDKISGALAMAERLCRVLLVAVGIWLDLLLGELVRL